MLKQSKYTWSRNNRTVDLLIVTLYNIFTFLDSSVLSIFLVSKFSEQNCGFRDNL